MKHQYLLLAILGMAALTCLPLASAEQIGGDQGWYVIHCNVYGANIYLDDKFVGTAPQGALPVPALTTGTPYSMLRVQKYGYSTFADSITKVPGKGEMVDLYAPLNELPPTTPSVVGSDMGWYNVHANVDGATVTFDNDAKGKTAKGVLAVQVYFTGTPYRAFTVYKAGYVPYTGPIER